MGHVANLLPERERELSVESGRAAYVADGAPPELAQRIVVLNTLSTAMDIVQISRESGRSLDEVANFYFAGGRLLWPADAPPAGAHHAGQHPVAVAGG